MVINNFNIFRAVSSPSKAHPPLPVNANTVLAFPVTTQRFKPVTKWGFQIIQLCSCLQQYQLTLSCSFYRRKPFGFSSLKQRLSVFASEALYCRLVPVHDQSSESKTQKQHIQCRGNVILLLSKATGAKTQFAFRHSGHILSRHDDFQAVDRKSTRLNSSHVRISYAVF